MALTAKDEGKSFPPIEPGVYHAVCYQVFDLGTHFNEKFGKSEHKIQIIWELPEVRITIDNKDLPRAISKRYTLTLHQKAHLRQDLECWRGKPFTATELKGFNILKLLGVNCQIQVLNKEAGDKVYSNVVAIMPLSKGAEKLEPENPVQSFSMEADEKIPEGIPGWISDMIMRSEEMAELNPEQGPPDDQFPPSEKYDDERYDAGIPF